MVLQIDYKSKTQLTWVLFLDSVTDWANHIASVHFFSLSCIMWIIGSSKKGQSLSEYVQH